MSLSNNLENKDYKQDKLKVLFATSDDPNKSGCGWYRVLQPAYYLARLFKNRMEVTFTDTLFDFDVALRDVFFFSRQVKADVVDYVVKMKQNDNRKFVILDFDDHLNAIPPFNPAYKYYANCKNTLRTMMQTADLLTFTQPYLAEQLLNTTGIKKPYILLPNAVDTKMAVEHPTSVNPIRIGWFGSVTHMNDLAMIRGIIEGLYKRVKEKVRLEVITFGPKQDFIQTYLFYKVPPFRWIHYDWLSPLDYLNTITKLGIHIGLAPLENNVFNRCKSNLKLLEYVLCGAVFLASDIKPYSETFTKYKSYTHTENKLDLWLNKLTTLTMEHDLRRNIHKNLLEELKSEHDCDIVYSKFGKQMLEAYEQWTSQLK